MSHIALYRKYRPSGFDHLIGQEAIKKTLKNTLAEDKVSHAYLFSGPRGTGKTSAAKLFAKAVNCQNLEGFEPCGKCVICQDNNPDIVEIDAASNNGVDEIRDIRDKINYTPVNGKYKVYIIDEVHMLTTGAFNALLKTLEEPPKHAIFILATTEPHKIPLTVLSRTQRYDFRKISNQAIIDRMTWIIGQEGVNVEKEALDVIARVAQGGMRDALSLLDQAIAHSDDKVTLDDVIELTGTVNLRLIGEMTKVLVNRETAKALDLLDEILDSGKEGKFLIDDLLSYFRDILVFRRLGDQANLTKAVTDASFKEIAGQLELPRVYDVIEQLSTCQQALKFTGNERITIEVSLMKITSLPTSDDFSLLREEIDQLKQYISGNGKLPAVVNNEVAATVIKSEQPEQTMTELQEEPKGTSLEKEDDNSKGLTDILSEIKSDLVLKSNSVFMEHINEKESDSHSNAESTMDESVDNTVPEPAEEEPQLDLNERLAESKEETDEGLDLFSLMENDLQAFSDSSNVSLEPDIQKEEKPSEESKPLSFIEQVERDMAAGADYIEFTSLSNKDFPSVVEDEHVEGPSDIEKPKSEDIPRSTKIDNVLEILSSATKAYKQEYLEKHEDVLAILKKERFATMALYREGQVVAINEKSLVVTYKDKAKVHLLEKVINRSVVKSIIEEVTNRTLDIVAVSEAEWESILQIFLAKR